MSTPGFVATHAKDAHFAEGIGVRAIPCSKATEGGFAARVKRRPLQRQTAPKASPLDGLYPDGYSRVRSPSCRPSSSSHGSTPSRTSAHGSASQPDYGKRRPAAWEIGSRLKVKFPRCGFTTVRATGCTSFVAGESSWSCSTQVTSRLRSAKSAAP